MILTQNGEKRKTMEIQIKCQGAATLKLAEILPFQGSLKRRGKKEIGQILRSVEKYGFSFPFFIWKEGDSNWCLDGHGRLEALSTLPNVSAVEFPVSYVDADSAEEAKQKLLRLNSQYGQMTIDSVLEFMDGIELEIDELALPKDVLKFKAQEADEEDNSVPEVQDEPISQPGEIYSLGNHRLMCGDSTSLEDVKRLCGADQAQLFLSDPPYNIAIQGGNHGDPERKNGLKIENDSMSDEDFHQFLVKAFSAADSVLLPGVGVYIWHSDREGFNFNSAFKAIKWKLHQCILWKKNSLVMGRVDYQTIHEPCLYGWKEGAAHKWNGGRDQTTVLNFDRPQRNGEHPTMKPVELFAYQIENSTDPGDWVLDLFGGSGTTIIAAEKKKRKALVMELDPKYCDVIRRRWKQWATENSIDPGIDGLD